MFQRWTGLNAADGKNVCHLEVITVAIHLVPFFIFKSPQLIRKSNIPKWSRVPNFKRVAMTSLKHGYPGK